MFVDIIKATSELAGSDIIKKMEGFLLFAADIGMKTFDVKIEPLMHL
jgi:hypothetical protein